MFMYFKFFLFPLHFLRNLFYILFVTYGMIHGLKFIIMLHNYVFVQQLTLYL